MEGGAAPRPQDFKARSLVGGAGSCGLSHHHADGRRFTRGGSEPDSELLAYGSCARRGADCHVEAFGAQAGYEMRAATETRPGASAERRPLRELGENSAPPAFSPDPSFVSITPGPTNATGQRRPVALQERPTWQSALSRRLETPVGGWRSRERRRLRLPCGGRTGRSDGRADVAMIPPVALPPVRPS